MITFLVTLVRFVLAVARSMKDPDFQALSFLVALTLLSGTLFYHGVEGWSLLDSFYFSSITLTTVGYGDLSLHARQQDLHCHLPLHRDRHHPRLRECRRQALFRCAASREAT